MLTVGQVSNIAGLGRACLFLLIAGRSDVNKEETVFYQRTVWGKGGQDQRSDSQAVWGRYILFTASEVLMLLQNNRNAYVNTVVIIIDIWPSVAYDPEG